MLFGRSGQSLEFPNPQGTSSTGLRTFSTTTTLELSVSLLAGFLEDLVSRNARSVGKAAVAVESGLVAAGAA
jgi:hypothetical protein